MCAQPCGTLPDAYDNLHLGIILYDPETADVIDVNDQATSLFGYTAAQLRELSVNIYSANTHSVSEHTLQNRLMAAADGHPQQFKWRVKRANGELIWVRVDMSRATFDDRPYILAEVGDITEHHNNCRRVSLLSRIIRHNLRNDVNIITGYAEKIAEESGGRSRQYAHKIIDQVTDIANIPQSVKQIEEATDTADSGWSLRNVGTVVSEAVEEYRAAYPDANISVTERTEMWVRVDDALTRALEHAIENSIVHNDRPDPAVEVIFGKSPNTGRVEIQIVDDGPRIRPVEIDALDGRAETTSTSHGSGVGLFVMQWCIESLGGEIKIEPCDNRGFDSMDVYQTLSNLDVNYLIPKRITSTERDAIETMEVDGREVAVERASVDDEMGSHSLQLLYVPSTKTDGTAVFATNLTVGPDEAAAFCHRYSRRWQIENEYKSIKNDFLAKTSSKEYRVRLFYFVFAVLLHNIWRLTDFLLKAAVDGPMDYAPVLTAGEVVELVSAELIPADGTVPRLSARNRDEWRCYSNICLTTHFLTYTEQ